MRPILMILLAYALICPVQLSAIPENFGQNQNRYILPSNLDVDLKISNEGKITGLLKPLTGVPENIKIRFLSSENIIVNNKSMTIKKLEKEQSFSINFSKKGSVEDQWIKILVEYLPDFESLSGKVSDKSNYPDQQLRLRLINKVKGFENAGQTFKEAAFYRFQEGNIK
ncbi:MAG: hypothetical protein ACQETH_16630 [Candidatus Rifleibacteriota bacterium]